MQTKAKLGTAKMFLDKEALGRALGEADARSGFVYDPTATPQKAREAMRAQGVRAEDNLFSRDIIQACCPDEFGEAGKE